MTTIRIPDTSNPWSCSVNNTRYSYPAGSVQTVPDEVAEIIHRADSFPAAPEEVKNPFEPKGFVTWPELMRELSRYIDPTAIAGYDKTKTQTLTHIEGVLTWTDAT